MFDELIRNIELLYNTGEKVRAEEVERIARELLIQEDGRLNMANYKSMINTTPLKLTSIIKNEDNKQYLGIQYKDVAVQFFEFDL